MGSENQAVHHVRSHLFLRAEDYWRPLADSSPDSQNACEEAIAGRGCETLVKLTP